MAANIDVQLQESSTVPRATAIPEVSDERATVVWHRKHLRTDDQRALAEAAEGDRILPLFVFDPEFYGGEGLACDSRIQFLHECLESLDTQYDALAGGASGSDAGEQSGHTEEGNPAGHAGEAGVAGDAGDSGAIGDSGDAATGATDDSEHTGDADGTSGPLTFGYGDPATILSRFRDRGWEIVTMRTPTSRYGKRRDRRVAEECDVQFVAGDGLVRDQEWSRKNWQDQITTWLDESQHTWDPDSVRIDSVPTGVSPAGIADQHDLNPTKTNVPKGGLRPAVRQLTEFTDTVHEYPRQISAPVDAREGTSGLSPYLNFGVLSIRQAYQHVQDHAPESRGQDMFTSRLVWNMHYNQKLVDWPAWTDKAVNPVLRGFNEDTHDPDLVTAWKRGTTGYPMVDASMRCLAETGWLNFRMRAMCASFFSHILHQPWWIGAEWYHHHLIDSDVGINYTQWQAQAGVVGKPTLRQYNPRKQVRDNDPGGEFIRRYVPELDPLPVEFLDRPERAPLHVQDECEISIGQDYPRPVVDYEVRREEFWDQYQAAIPEAAAALADPELAKRVSFSGGRGAAYAIAQEHGGDAGDTAGSQVGLTELQSNGEGDAGVLSPPGEGEPDGDDRGAVPTELSGTTRRETTPSSNTGESEGQSSLDAFD